MIPYRDTGGDSGVVAYDVGEDYIDVRFKNGAVYRYTNATAGSGNISTMKRLAARGDGLNSYINLNLKKEDSARLA